MTLDLPRYTSEDILYERLMYSIEHCQSVDLDRNVQQHWIGL